MAGVNKVILVGHLGKDPELKFFEGNIAKTSFSLATSEYFKDKSGVRNEHTEWHHIVIWRTLAENAARLLRKGSHVYIEGKLQTRQWTDKEGIKRSITEIVADNFIVLQNKADAKSNDTGSQELP